MGDEGLNQIPAGILDRFGATEVGGVSFDERRIEIVLTNEQAELVTQLRLAVAESIRSGMTI